MDGHEDERQGFVVTTCEDWCGEYQPSQLQLDCESGLYDEEIAALTGDAKPEAPASAGVATNG